MTNITVDIIAALGLPDRAATMKNGTRIILKIVIAFGTFILFHLSVENTADGVVYLHIDKIALIGIAFKIHLSLIHIS